VHSLNTADEWLAYSPVSRSPVLGGFTPGQLAKHGTGEHPTGGQVTVVRIGSAGPTALVGSS
jgi:hypothetical protein